jgi:glycosyltransferase involved in cell wall biosynthesis
MRIGMMVDLYKPYISGVTIYVEVNRKYLEEMGHDVFIFTFSGDKDYIDDEPNVYRSPGLPIAEGFALNFVHRRGIKRVIQSMDIVHVHHPFISGQLALRYCKPLNIPIVFTNHTRYDLYAQTYAPAFTKEISQTFIQTYLPRFCSRVDMVVSPSKGMADILRSLRIDAPITVVPNGVDIQKFRQAADPSKRDKLGFSHSDVLFIYAGRLATEKNLPMVIKSFNAVAQSVENAHLLIVGSGAVEDFLKEMANQTPSAENIHFTGRIPYDELPDYLSMCDVFVTASTSEVHPLSVIEAMATGLPVLGITSPGIGDTVEDGVTGLLSTNDPMIFTAKMMRLCLDSELRKEMSAAALEASNQYSIENTGAIMLSHYERLVNQTESRRQGIGYNLRKAWENLFTK